MDYKVKGLLIEKEESKSNFSNWKSYVERVAKEKNKREDKKNA